MSVRNILWISGATLGSLLFLPPVLESLNNIVIQLSKSSEMSYYGVPTFKLLLIAWLIFGIIWWIILQFFADLKIYFNIFLITWVASLLIFCILPYWLAIITWVLIVYFVFTA